jgi:RNA polymerase sigma factor (TIGR02999 family)
LDPLPDAPPADSSPAARTAVTHELARLCRGDAGDRTVLAGLVYEDLRRAAASLLRRERAAHTLQPTALVHEAWLRLVDETAFRGNEVTAAHRAFLSHAVQAMRRILIEHARARLRQKRGGKDPPVPLPAALAVAIDSAPEMLDLDAGLEQLAQRRPRLAQLAELRIYGGLSTAEAAGVVGVSLATAKTEWALAQALLTRFVRGRAGEG